jgi:predicted ATPase/signal transduction histidine kinase
MSMPDTLGAYTIRETLHHQKGAVEYRAVRTTDQLPVLLKLVDPRWCRPCDVERLKNEYALGQALDTSAAIRPLAFELYKGTHVLVMEDLGGNSLDRRPEPIPIERFLSLAIRMATAVEEIHALGLVHRDLRPENFVVDSTGEVRITNFGLASWLPREQMTLRSSAQLMEGSLPYMSPEQTGRMNRPVDRRSDLYSLGVTFYQMLTGLLPFTAEDLVGWVHSHIARMPAPMPPQLVPAGAEIVQSIVRKMLAKVPEDRYQSAAALREDLERCRDEWMKLGRIEPFALGVRDSSEHLIIPRKLYGREAEVSVLLSSFERMADTGVPELRLVSGPPGVGKTSLVQALHERIVRRRGLFATGKFELQKREIPYVATPARELILDILAESADRVAEWKDRAQLALGNNGQAAVDIVPELELLIGPQPPIPTLPPLEAENRAQFAFRSLVGVCASREHPLAVFLDDLQWADAASLRMLQHLVSHPDVRYLLVIGAYRDNEVSPSHPLTRAIEQTRKAGGIVTDLAVVPLSVAHLGQMVADAVRSRTEDTADLARLVHAKTAGNPFFVVQFLIELERRGLMAHDRRTGLWRWDVARIAAEGFTDNVVQLMVDRLELLPHPTQEVLRICACIGDVVDFSLLAEVVGRPAEEIDASLRSAFEGELLVGREKTLQFSHDRVREAAYALVPEGERTAAHLRIGRVLLSRTPVRKIEEDVFTIVNQLDRGAALIESRSERDRLAELNLLAGQRAKSTGAYTSGAQYFSAGSALLGNDAWERSHDLAFGLELGASECQYLSGKRDEAEQTLSILAHRAKDVVEAAAAARGRISLHMTRGEPEKALDGGIEFLRRVGIELPAHPSREQVLGECDRTWQSLGGRRIEELLDLPIMTDPAWRAVTDVLQAMIAPALSNKPYLHTLISFHIVQISLRSGNVDASCSGYVGMAGMVGPILGDYPRCIRLGQVASTLVERLHRYRAFVHAGIGSTISIWSQHVRACAEIAARAFEESVEDGTLNGACYSICLRISALLFAGTPLDEILRETQKGLDFVRRAGFDFAAAVLVSHQRLVLSLQGKTDALGSLGGGEFEEAKFEARLAEGGSSLALPACWYFARKLQACAVAGDWGAAIGAASRARQLLWTSMVFLERVEITFYEALALAACQDDPGASPEQKSKHRGALAESQKQLAIWAEICPENFRDGHALISAEIARIDGEPERASECYEQAIRGAKGSGFVHGEAIAYERASFFYRARGFALFADAYLREARACYLRWGAEGKVRQIDRLHPALIQPAPRALTSMEPVVYDQIDLLSVLRASQTISREIDHETLLRTLLEAVLQQGGARTARLVFVHEEELRLEAEAFITGEDAHGETVQTRLLGSAAVTPSSPVPASVLQYARATKERVLLDDARADAGRFAGDAYLEKAKTRSLLCQPVLRQDRTIALFVLENVLAPGVFTAGRMGALELLSTQAAISIENARLLKESQDSIRERDVFLALASHELRTPVTSLVLTTQRLRGEKLDAAPEGVRNAAALFERQVGRLRSLIDDLMTVGQILLGRLALHSTPTDLAALVCEEMARSTASFERAGCALTLRADRPAHGAWDADKVIQIVRKLVANALKFGAGSPIEVTVEQGEDVARLVVVDHGIGIEADALPHIFGRFERGVSSGLYGGLGIGLYIVQHMVHALGGSIRAESTPRVATTFTVELPTGLRQHDLTGSTAPPPT